MNKRLEELKQSRIFKDAHGNPFYTADKEDYEWIIQQAERVEELEKLLNRADVDLYNMFNNYKKIKSERNHYKQALEKIASTEGKTYNNGIHIKELSNIASEALAGEPNET